MEPTNREVFDVESSNVESFEYLTFPDGNKLRVRFKHGGVYDYTGVPREALNQVLTAKSIGSTFHQIIRNEYPFEKVDV
jgi:hypothetical protein